MPIRMKIAKPLGTEAPGHQTRIDNQEVKFDPTQSGDTNADADTANSGVKLSVAAPVYSSSGDASVPLVMHADGVDLADVDAIVGKLKTEGVEIRVGDLTSGSGGSNSFGALGSPHYCAPVYPSFSCGAATSDLSPTGITQAALPSRTHVLKGSLPSSTRYPGDLYLYGGETGTRAPLSCFVYLDELGFTPLFQSDASGNPLPNYTSSSVVFRVHNFQGQVQWEVNWWDLMNIPNVGDSDRLPSDLFYGKSSHFYIPDPMFWQLFVDKGSGIDWLNPTMDSFIYDNIPKWFSKIGAVDCDSSDALPLYHTNILSYKGTGKYAQLTWRNRKPYALRYFPLFVFAGYNTCSVFFPYASEYKPPDPRATLYDWTTPVQNIWWGLTYDTVSNPQYQQPMSTCGQIAGLPIGLIEIVGRVGSATTKAFVIVKQDGNLSPLTKPNCDGPGG